MGTVRITCTSAPCTSPAEDVFGEKWCLLESLKTVSCFHSMSMYRVSLSSSVSSEGREPASKIRKKKKRGFEENHVRAVWRMEEEKRLEREIKTTVARVSCGRHCTKFQDRWMQSKNTSKWREVSPEVHEWASSL